MNRFQNVLQQMARNVAGRNNPTIPLPVLPPDEERIDVAKLRDAIKDCLQSNSVQGLAVDIGTGRRQIDGWSQGRIHKIDSRTAPKLLAFFGEEILT